MARVWVNGKADAKIDGQDRALAYGDGLFATMRSYAREDLNTGILFVEQHLSRLQQGAHRLGIRWDPDKALEQQLSRLGQQHPGACIKLLLSRGVGGRGYAPPERETINQIVSVHDMPSHYHQWQQTGIALASCGVTLARQPLLAGMKHLNRLEQVLIKSTALPSGFDDYLVQDTQGLVIGTSMGNLFLLQEGKVTTPAMDHCGISGVMREQLIASLLAKGVDVHCAPVSMAMLAQAQHVFISNSLFGLVDIVRVNDTYYDKSPLSDDFRQQLFLTL